MIKLKSLICENEELTSFKFAKILKDAYSSFFDSDDVKIVYRRRLTTSSEPEILFEYIISVIFTYKPEKKISPFKDAFLVKHYISYLKLPLNHPYQKTARSHYGVNHKEYLNYLKSMKKMNSQIPSSDILKFQSNTNMCIYYNIYEKLEFLERWWELAPYISKENKGKSILNLLKDVKKYIDNYSGSGPDKDNNEGPKIPTGPTKIKVVAEVLNKKYSVDIKNKFVIIGNEDEVSSNEPLNDDIDKGAISELFTDNNIKFELMNDVSYVGELPSGIMKLPEPLKKYIPPDERITQSRGRNKIRKNIFIFPTLIEAQKAARLMTKIWEDEYEDPSDNTMIFTPARAESYVKTNRR